MKVALGNINVAEMQAATARDSFVMTSAPLRQTAAAAISVGPRTTLSIAAFWPNPTRFDQ